LAPGIFGTWQHDPAFDEAMWIAALVLQHSLTLCARDAHFDALPQLPAHRTATPRPTNAAK
jgi:hypothetical protein